MHCEKGRKPRASFELNVVAGLTGADVRFVRIADILNSSNLNNHQKISRHLNPQRPVFTRSSSSTSPRSVGDSTCARG